MDEMFLIDKKALLESHWWAELKDEFDKIRARLIILSAPKVDAVPVVRCKDCKYYYDYGVNREYCCHRSEDGTQVFDVKFKADDFCSYGERKDNA